MENTHVFLPGHFQQTDVNLIRRLIAQQPLGALVVMTANGLDVSHIPFCFHRDPPPHGTLHGHIARKNSLWRDDLHDAEAVVIFRGPNKFISPSWYATKKETGRVVPTWNYAVAHVFGKIAFIDRRPWLRAHLEKLTDLHEAGQRVPWRMSDAPSDYIDRLLRTLVGVEVRIDRIVGVWKASQNRPARDRHGVVAGLMREGSAAAIEMARLVQEEDARNQSGRREDPKKNQRP